MQISKVIIIVATGLLLFSCSFSRLGSGRNGTSGKAFDGIARADTSRRVDSSKVGRPKSYREVITAAASTDSGLIIIHKLDNRYFFEVPVSLMDRDVLIVNRIAKGATGIRPEHGYLGYAGDQIGESVIQFGRGPDFKLFIRLISFTERSSDSTANGMYRTVRNSNLQPILSVFDIKAFASDSSSVVVDATDFLNSDNPLLYFDPALKKEFGLGGWLKDRSYVEQFQSFPVNVELQVVNTYSKDDQTASFELNTSFVLLPKEPMKPRYFDIRVGYYPETYVDFDAPGGVDVVNMINRWRLEPKDEDRQKYLNGELVEPKKPIVYYIDPATPKKWVPFLIQGVNDWEKAFEKAGFKNAIYAMEAPVDDPSFNLLDARHNAIIYKPSLVPNASGPNVHDPRTGEILETHINWYHNVMQLIHDWYMVQAGPNDPKARKMVFDDSMMGQLIRFVSSHEVGHTLGLLHNFGASSTVPVDSLRSRGYLDSNGFCPSIMDYARYNYVAQPQDSIPERDLLPRIGMYDKWAIEWGYRWLPQLKDRREEEKYMNEWIIGKLKTDKRYWFGQEYFIAPGDPRKQSEDLGDDAMKAGYYGIQNLKIVMANLGEWTKEANKDYTSLARMQRQVIGQFQQYIFHVYNNIGLYYLTPKTVEQDGKVVEFVPKEKQRRAVEFLQEQLFATPEWLVNKDIFSKVGYSGPFIPTEIQRRLMPALVDYNMYWRMAFDETNNEKDAYTFDELLTDLERGIFKELDSKAKIDFNRRILQRVYVDALITAGNVNHKNDPIASLFDAVKVQTDYVTILQAHLRKLLRGVSAAVALYKDHESVDHLVFLKDRLKIAIDPNASTLGLGSQAKNTFYPVNVDARFNRDMLFGLNGFDLDFGPGQANQLISQDGDFEY